MKTAVQYQHEITELQIEDLLKAGKSKEGGKATSERLAEAEEKLRSVENNLHLDLHALRAQYQGRQAAIRMQNAQKSQRNRVDDEQRLADEREEKLAPYEQVSKQIEELLKQLDQAKGNKEVA